MKIVLMLSLCLLLGFGVLAQTAEKVDETQKVTKLTLAKKDSEGNIVEDPEVFGIKDVPIYCYIDLNLDTPTLVKMEVIAVKVKGLRPNLKFVSVKYKTKKGENSVSFDASPKTVWATGDYRVDVFLDGKLSESKEFKIEIEKQK